MPKLTDEQIDELLESWLPGVRQCGAAGDRANYAVWWLIQEKLKDAKDRTEVPPAPPQSPLTEQPKP